MENDIDKIKWNERLKKRSPHLDRANVKQKNFKKRGEIATPPPPLARFLLGAKVVPTCAVQARKKSAKNCTKKLTTCDFLLGSFHDEKRIQARGTPARTASRRRDAPQRQVGGRD